MKNRKSSLLNRDDRSIISQSVSVNISQYQSYREYRSEHEIIYHDKNSFIGMMTVAVAVHMQADVSQASRQGG